jgi:integrase/recombinase XerD
MEPETKKLANLLTGFYLAKQAEGCSPNTIIEYKKDFAHFARWCRAQGKTDPATLAASDLRAFLAHLRTEPNGRGKPLAAKTVYNCWAALRSFYKWLAEEAGAPNPMAMVPAPRVPEPVIEPLTREEVAAILKACEGCREAKTKGRAVFSMRRDTATRDRAIVLVLLDAGLRASELCNLTIGDVDLATGKVLVRCGKGGKGRIVYLGKMARRAVWKYLAGRQTKADEPLFLTREGRALNPDRLVKLFANLGERAGVVNLHPHRLRHAFATEFLRNGGNLLGLQRLLGHSSLEMVRRYAAIAEADLAKAHETGSPADKWRL